MAAGSIRKKAGKNGPDRYYVRTRMKVIDPETGKPKWKDVEKGGRERQQGQAAQASEAAERDAQEAAGPRLTTGTFKPTATHGALTSGQRWLREHVRRNLKPSTAANYRDTFLTHISPRAGGVPRGCRSRTR